MLIQCSFKHKTSYCQLVAKTTLSGGIAIKYDVCRRFVYLSAIMVDQSAAANKDQHLNTYVPKASESSVHQVIIAHI